MVLHILDAQTSKTQLRPPNGTHPSIITGESPAKDPKKMAKHPKNPQGMSSGVSSCQPPVSRPGPFRGVIQNGGSERGISPWRVWFKS